MQYTREKSVCISMDYVKNIEVVKPFMLLVPLHASQDALSWGG